MDADVDPAAGFVIGKIPYPTQSAISEATIKKWTKKWASDGARGKCNDSSSHQHPYNSCMLTGMDVKWTHPLAASEEPPHLEFSMDYSDTEFALLQKHWPLYASPPVKGDSTNVFPAIMADVFIITRDKYQLIRHNAHRFSDDRALRDWCKTNLDYWVRFP